MKPSPCTTVSGIRIEPTPYRSASKLPAEGHGDDSDRLPEPQRTQRRAHFTGPGQRRRFGPG